jgi:hypothetical protein
MSVADGASFCTRCGAAVSRGDASVAGGGAVPSGTAGADYKPDNAPSSGTGGARPSASGARDDRFYESARGADAERQAPSSPPTAAYAGARTDADAGAPKKPLEELNTSGMLVWSIITLICCSSGAMFGMIALIFSAIAGVEKSYNTDKAKKYLYYAKILNIVALIIGLIGGIVIVAFMTQIITAVNQLATAS